MQDNRVKVSPKDVLAFLADGKTREEIREHYGLTKSDMKKMFEHPDLKGRKTKKAPGFVFEEETPSEEISAGNNETSDTATQFADAQDSTGTDGEEQGPTEQASQWAN